MVFVVHSFFCYGFLCPFLHRIGVSSECSCNIICLGFFFFPLLHDSMDVASLYALAIFPYFFTKARKKTLQKNTGKQALSS